MLDSRDNKVYKAKLNKQELKMQCCVSFCRNTSDNVSTSEGQGKDISFYELPSEKHLRVAWLRALGKKDSHLPDYAVICSQHFLYDDIYETRGLRQIVTGAIPSTVQVCMICLDTDSKLILMSKHKLEKEYEKLTGHPLCDQGNLKQTLCVQCAQKLINFSRFRDKSLRARALMMDLVDKHELITLQHIKMINRTKHQLKSSMVLTTLGPDHCDLHILEHPSEDKQTELEKIGPRDVVKTEESDDSMSVDGDMEVKHEEDNNVNDFVQDPLKYESAPLQCTLCLEEFFQDHEYMQHMSVHLQNGEGDGDCDTSQVCKPHTAVSSSSSHSSLITENISFICDICGKYYKRKSVLVKHIKTHSEVRQFTCKICHQECKFRSHFARHMRTHTREKPFTCSICNSKFAQNSHLVCHMRTHTGIKPYVCELCEYKCARKSDLVRHMRTHTGEKPFTCNICNSKFALSSVLQRHMRTHTGIKPYACELCEYKCARKSHLVNHMRTHTGEKPLTCNICNRKFARSSALQRHMRTHTGIKSYACDLCEYKCARKSNLVSHIRTHTGEKPHSCAICEYKYSQKRSLNKHMMTHTGKKPFTSKI